MTDGHTRAAAAYLAGFREIPCFWDESTLDMAVYAADVDMCVSDGIRDVTDLAGRIVSHKDYERLWRKRCMGIYDKTPYQILRQKEEVIFYAYKPVTTSDFYIHRIGEHELGLFERHLALCGQKALDPETWNSIFQEGTEYFLLFERCRQRLSPLFRDGDGARRMRDIRRNRPSGLR